MNSLLPAEFSKMETFRRATLRKSACDPHPPPSPGDGGGYIRWAEIRDVSSWAMERVVYFIGAGHADVLGGASGHVASTPRCCTTSASSRAGSMAIIIFLMTLPIVN
jgi:hypothetical protein